jgi:hypothetical protein
MSSRYSAIDLEERASDQPSYFYTAGLKRHEHYIFEALITFKNFVANAGESSLHLGCVKNSRSSKENASIWTRHSALAVGHSWSFLSV